MNEYVYVLIHRMKFLKEGTETANVEAVADNDKILDKILSRIAQNMLSNGSAYDLTYSKLSHSLNIVTKEHSHSFSVERHAVRTENNTDEDGRMFRSRRRNVDIH